MTQLDSGRGMRWATSDEAHVGLYTVSVTATSGSLSQTTTYFVEIESASCSSLVAPAHDATKTYTVTGSEDQLEV